MLLSAGGTALQQFGANQDRQDQARRAAEDLRRNTELNNRAGERVSQEVKNVAAANPDEERKAAQNDFIEALRKAKVSNGGADFGGVPGASDRFAADVGQAQDAATAQGRALSGNLAAIDAPQFARIKENRGLTDTATDLSRLEQQGRGQDFLSQLRAARAGDHSGLESLGSGISAFGNAYGQRAPKTPPPKKFGYLDQAVNAGVS
jgi:hypothetical protein